MHGMEKQEKSYDASRDGKEKISTKDLFGFLAWYEDPSVSSREKKLLKKTIDAAIDERREVVEKEFEKMIADDPALRAAFESLPAEMAVSLPEEAELMNELQKSPQQFEKYIQWFGDIMDQKGLSANKQDDIAEGRDILRAISNAERGKSLNAKHIIAMEILFIRQMKKILRQHDVGADILTKEAFQKWLQSKKIPGTGDR